MRADMWRYAILYAFGGIYADIDVLALHPMEQWLPPVADGKHWPPGRFRGRCVRLLLLLLLLC